MTTTPTTPATVELLPCPFCGSAGQIVWPITLECACTNPKCVLADSIEMTNLHILPEDWNRRAIDRRGGVDAEELLRKVLKDISASETDAGTMIHSRAANNLMLRFRAALGQAQGGERG